MNCQKCGHDQSKHKVFSDGFASCVHDPGEGYPLCGCSRTPRGIELDAWKLALQSLTPGGSEFTEPHECVAYINERTHQKHPQRIVRLEAELASCKAALQRLVTWYDGPDDKDELFLAIDDARLALGQELKS